MNRRRKTAAISENKMDATLKRKILMVAIVTIAHFFLSVCFGTMLGFHVVELGGISDGEGYISFAAWGYFELITFFILQPQFLLAYIFLSVDSGFDFNLAGSSYCIMKLVGIMSRPSLIWPMLVSIPIWSFCFSILFTKVVSRFPRRDSLVTRHSSLVTL